MREHLRYECACEKETQRDREHRQVKDTGRETERRSEREKESERER